MALYRVRFVGEQVTGDPADDFVWSFGLDAPSAPTDGELGALIDVLGTNLNTAVGSITPASLFQQGSSITHAEAYPALGGEAVALAAADPPIAFTSGGQVPGEVAVVMSYMVQTLRGARPVGRTFLGPLSANIVDSQSLRVATADATALGTAWANMLDDLALVNGDWIPSVITADGLTSRGPIIAVRVDNAFDTMRSRGVEATQYTTFELGA